jgi:diguanylate cyclase (GGDEF)-like protein
MLRCRYTESTVRHEERSIRPLFPSLKDTRLDRSLAARVALLCVSFFVPLAGAATILIGQQSARIALTERERGGIVLTARTVAVVEDLRRLRDRMEFDRQPATVERRDVHVALDALDAYASGVNRSPELAQHLARLRNAISAIPQGDDGAPAVAAALDAAKSLFELTDERSSLDTDADAVIALLLDAYDSELPSISLQIDRAKLILARGSREGAPPTGQRISAAVLTGQAQHAFDVAAADVANAVRYGFDAPSLDRSIPSIRRRFDALIDLSESGNNANDVGTRRFANRTRRAADAIEGSVDVAEADLATRIDVLLAARSLEEARTLFLMRAEAFIAVLVGLWIALLIGRTIRDRDRRELHRAEREAERLAAELDAQRKLEDLAVTEAHFRAVFDRSSIGVAILDRDATVLRSNRALEELSTAVDSVAICAKHPAFVRLVSGEIESFTTEIERETAEGPHAWEATLSLVRDDDGAARFAIAMIKDVTERRRIDDRLRYEATHDILSGLPNRAYFIERLRAEFFSGSEPEGVPAVLFVDLDEFKFVNDSLGHAVGDRVLVGTAERLRLNTTNNDCIARFGGDEFAVLLDGRHTRDELEAKVHRLGRALAEPHVLDGREIFVTASIGVAYVHADYRNVEDVLRDADTAMYHAKATGRARSAVFDVSMHDHASRRLDVATQLRRALERDQFYLVYQPVVSLATGAIQSCEVLLRWESPELGLVSPSEFIPIAEELGLIVPIGRYVLDRACRQFAQWRDAGMRHPGRISVNASVREIVQVDFADTVEATIARYGMKPGQLILEVTETAILSSGKFSAGLLDRLKAAGVALAIDDFGTGYSSLRYLQQFPFDQLKIDRSFVGGADGRLASEPIVTMLLTLAKSCGVGVVAEGVETPAQAARLRSLGCTSAQGYLYGRPCRAQILPELFRKEADFAS